MPTFVDICWVSTQFHLDLAAIAEAALPQKRRLLPMSQLSQVNFDFDFSTKNTKKNEKSILSLYSFPSSHLPNDEKVEFSSLDRVDLDVNGDTLKPAGLEI